MEKEYEFLETIQTTAGLDSTLKFKVECLDFKVLYKCSFVTFGYIVIGLVQNRKILTKMLDDSICVRFNKVKLSV
jgi:hypothetical protein